MRTSHERERPRAGARGRWEEGNAPNAGAAAGYRSGGGNSSEKNAAITELKNQVAGMSIEIAEKILRSELSSDEKQKALVQNLLKDVNMN